MVHSEDREELMQQLKWDLLIPQQNQSTTANNKSSVEDQSTSGKASKSASQMSLQEILNSRKSQQQ